MTTKTNQKKWVKTLQFFAAYLVAAWTLLQFVDWILNRYNISPHWVDILLWFFVGIIPSLLIYLYHQERINQRIIKRREKIIIPLNFVLLFVGLYLGFGNSDLGATTRTIDYTTEQGEQKFVLITKEEFRKGFPIFNFEPKTKDSTKAWLEFGISLLLNEDLLQNKNLNPEVRGFINTTDKVREASYFFDFYVDGEFKVKDSTYIITTFIRNSADAKVIAKESFEGNDVLSLIDDMTVFVTHTFTSKEFNAPKYPDLDVKDFTSSSLKALEYYRYGDFENAIKEDSTFALAYLSAGKTNLIFNRSKFEERNLADKAYQYRNKLPLQKQGETLMLKYLAYDEFENAEELVNLQLEVDPSNDTYNNILYNIYGRTKNLKAYTERAYTSWKNYRNSNNAYNLIEAGFIREDYDKVLKEIYAYMLLHPNDDKLFAFKLRAQLLKGDIKEVIKTQDKIKLLHPDWENLTKVYDVAIAYLKDHKPTKKDLQKFEGEYRSNSNEQTFTFWVENNSLLQYVSNQRIAVKILAGDNVLVNGEVLSGRTWKDEFLKNQDGSFYAFIDFQNDFSSTYTALYWKIDNSIKKAESLLEARKLDSAKIAYEKAIKANPKHYYLKDALSYIDFVKNIDSVTLQNQFKEVVGTYGPRKFWVEKGKLFYKRENLNGQTFPEIELLPVSKYKYINLSKYRSQFEFEVLENGTIASFAWDYDAENEVWAKWNGENNYFLKDE